MARRALALADVLREELQWIRPGSPEKAAERWTAADWSFIAQDVYEPLTFLAKIERTRVAADIEKDRYAVLVDQGVASADFHVVSAGEAATRIAEALSELVRDDTLCMRLLKHRDFREIVETSSRLLHLILTNATLRRQYVSDGDRLEGLLWKHRDLLREALDDGDDVAALLGFSDIRKAVRQSPQLLGAIIDSPALREALDDFAMASRLRSLYGPPSWAQRKKQAELKEAPEDPAAVLDDLKLGASHPAPPAPVEGAMFRANALLLEAAFDAHLHDHRDESAMLRRFNQEWLVALCLSGGGIRSATFNLGILQGLSRLGLLPKIDYLSTVSGGGYIGSWLSSWIRRHVDGTEGVADDLAAATIDPLDPEPNPVGHLREYSNYLAPRPTLFGPDVWSIFATYARNLLLNWTMLLPPVIALLLVPRLYEMLILHSTDYERLLWGGRVYLVAAMIALAWIRPAGEFVPGKAGLVAEIRRRRKRVILFVALAFGAGVMLTAAWAIRGRMALPRHDAWNVFVRSLKLFALANGLATLTYLGRYYDQLRHSDHEKLNVLDRKTGLRWFGRFIITRVGLPKILLEVASFAAATVAGAGLVYLGARLVPANEIHGAIDVLAITYPERFVIGAVPLFLLVLFVEWTLMVGMSTLVSSELEREWWARAAAVTLLAGVGWLIVALLAIVGPALLTQSPKIISAVGGVAGLIALLRSHSNQKKLKEWQTVWRSRLLTVAAAVALVVIISGLSLLVSKAMTGLSTAPQPAEKVETIPAEILGDVTLPPGYTLSVSKPSTHSTTEEILHPGPATERHIRTLRSRESETLLSILALAIAVALAAGFLFDVNTYSMHGMYRNRLIRAYLGASRWFRRPEPFTGFDPQDDVLMAQLRPELLWSTSFHDLDGFVAFIAAKQDQVFMTLPRRVQRRIRDFLKLKDRAKRDALRNEIMTVVFGSLNQMMRTTDLKTSSPAPATVETMRRNREYLERTYPKFIRPRATNTPLHLVNVALNLVRGDNLAWQERKAESFTISPLHSGAAVTRLAYRDSAEYGGPRGISLGTAMAISGAAVSANMGYNSSSTVTALMALFNARLGWWLGNPARDTYKNAGPTFALKPLLNEAVGNTNDQSDYVFLSDGGHFENLGLYEMVRRRCRIIIVSDAAADPDYAFGDLANAIRKIRIDLGIPIEFKTMKVGREAAAYCVLGRIGYKSAAPPGHKVNDGWLIYIKPKVDPEFPVDIVNYEQEGKPFPQEPTIDQFFSETQFESYRELGAHIISRLAGTSHATLTPASFLRRLIEKYGKP